MTDTKKQAKETAEGSERWSFVSYLVEQVFDIVENFVGRLADIASDRAELFADRALHKLTWYVLLGVGILFLLVGSAEVISALIQFPGVGQIIVGIFALLAAGSMRLFFRTRAE